MTHSYKSTGKLKLLKSRENILKDPKIIKVTLPVLIYEWPYVSKYYTIEERYRISTRRFPANTRHLPDVVLMLERRRRLWANIKKHLANVCFFCRITFPLSKPSWDIPMSDNSPIYILKAFESGCIGLHLQQFKNHSRRIKQKQSRIKTI